MLIIKMYFYTLKIVWVDKLLSGQILKLSARITKSPK